MTKMLYNIEKYIIKTLVDGNVLKKMGSSVSITLFDQKLKFTKSELEKYIAEYT